MAGWVTLTGIEVAAVVGARAVDRHRAAGSRPRGPGRLPDVDEQRRLRPPRPDGRYSFKTNTSVDSQAMVECMRAKGHAAYRR
jgi:hypothetical protein